MLNFSFVHEDTRIVWAVRKLLDLINSVVTATATEIGSVSADSTSSNTPVIMLGMTITPEPGKYLVTLGGDIDIPPSNTAFLGIAIDTVVQAPSGRIINCTDAGTPPVSNFLTCFSSQSIVTVNGSQEIQGIWSVSSGTATTTHRQMTLVKVN